MKLKLLTSSFLLFLFCLQINNSTAYCQISGWVKKPDVSGQPSGKRVKNGGSITAMGNYVYLILGNNTLDFMKYSILEDSWLVVEPGVPLGPKNKKVKKGACIVNDGEYVYVLKGGKTNEFFRFNPIEGIWDSLAEPDFTKGVKGGFACYVNDRTAGRRYIYSGSGSNTKEWKRYDIEYNTWEIPVPETLPVKKAKIGSGLAWDNIGTTIFFLLGKGKENDFYSFNLNSPSSSSGWLERKDLPFYKPGFFKKRKVKEGGCIEYYNKKIYAVKGGGTKEFWYYDLMGDSWVYVGEIVGESSITPEKGIKTGKSMAYSSTADGIFCIIGKNTNEFWFYSEGVNPPKSTNLKNYGDVNIENETQFDINYESKIRTGINYIIPTNEITKLRIYNTSGEFLYSSTADKVSTLLNKLTSGIYILHYEAKGYKGHKKLIIAR